MCSKYHGFKQYFQAMLVINCLRLFVDCYHGDGSDGRHVYKVSRPYVLLSATCVALYPEAICCWW